MWGFLIAILSGALMSIQGVFNTGVTEKSSVWTAACFVQFTGFLTCLLVWMWKDRTGITKVFQVENKLLLFGGVIGAFITITVVKAIEQLGPSKAIIFIVVAQIIVAYLIELFGIFGVEKALFDWKKVVGASLAIIGIIVFKLK